LAASLAACGDEVDAGNSTSDAGAVEDAAKPITVVDAANAVDAPSVAVDAGCATNACAVAIAVNGHNSCAIMGDTTVRCWGANGEGQLGSGTPDASGSGIDVPTPTPVQGLTGAKSLALGGSYDGVTDAFACAVLVDGGADCWGIDSVGQLGRGDASPPFADPNPAPVQLAGPALQISAFDETACAVDAHGNVACWGSNGDYEIVPTFGGGSPAPTPIVAAATFTQISVGSAACAVSTDHHVWCWGHPLFGDLGRPATDGGVQDYAPAPVPGLDGVVQVASGSTAACALTTDGVAHCWGGSSNGTSLLGRGDVDAGKFDPNPAPVVMPTGVTFTALVGHDNGFCALDASGAVWCWGHNYDSSDGISAADGGELYPIWVPTQVPSLANIAQIASGAGAHHVCALDHAGHVECWGYNRYDQLGTANVDGSVLTSLVPLDVVF
jgi:alpha-tubulin suppressor-like RCC1 family protein